MDIAEVLQFDEELDSFDTECVKTGQIRQTRPSDKLLTFHFSLSAQPPDFVISLSFVNLTRQERELTKTNDVSR